MYFAKKKRPHTEGSQVQQKNDRITPGLDPVYQKSKAHSRSCSIAVEPVPGIPLKPDPKVEYDYNFFV